MPHPVLGAGGRSRHGRCGQSGNVRPGREAARHHRAADGRNARREATEGRFVTRLPASFSPRGAAQARVPGASTNMPCPPARRPKAPASGRGRLPPVRCSARPGSAGFTLLAADVAVPGAPGFEDRPPRGLRRPLRGRPPGLACLFHSWGSLLDLQYRVAGRPGLLGTRGGERSEPERVPNRDGGRIEGWLGRKGPFGSLVATVLPYVLNGYSSIEARTTSTGEGKNT